MGKSPPRAASAVNRPRCTRFGLDSEISASHRALASPVPKHETGRIEPAVTDRDPKLKSPPPVPLTSGWVWPSPRTTTPGQGRPSTKNPKSPPPHRRPPHQVGHFSSGRPEDSLGGLDTRFASTKRSTPYLTSHRKISGIPKGRETRRLVNRLIRHSLNRDQEIAGFRELYLCCFSGMTNLHSRISSSPTWVVTISRNGRPTNAPMLTEART